MAANIMLYLLIINLKCVYKIPHQYAIILWVNNIDWPTQNICQ